MDVREACELAGAAHASADVNRGIAERHRLHGQVADELVDHAQRQRPCQLVVEPDFVDRFARVARANDEAVKIRLVVGEFLVANVGGHRRVADDRLARGARVDGSAQPVDVLRAILRHLGPPGEQGCADGYGRGDEAERAHTERRHEPGQTKRADNSGCGGPYGGGDTGNGGDHGRHVRPSIRAATAPSAVA